MILLFSIALLCFAVPASAGETLANSVSAYHFNDATGSVSDIRFLPSGKRVVTAVCNSYLLMAHGEKDVTAFEAQDRVIEKKKNGGSICYRCVNPLLPGLVISKRYWLENNGLRRELTFQNQDSRKRYLIPLTDKLTIELDIFEGDLAPLKLAEVEFETKEEAESFLPPKWFGKDVTFSSDYHNSTLSRVGLPT